MAVVLWEQFGGGTLWQSGGTGEHHVGLREVGVVGTVWWWNAVAIRGNWGTSCWVEGSGEQFGSGTSYLILNRGTACKG